MPYAGWTRKPGQGAAAGGGCRQTATGRDAGRTAGRGSVFPAGRCAAAAPAGRAGAGKQGQCLLRRKALPDGRKACSPVLMVPLPRASWSGRACPAYAGPCFGPSAATGLSTACPRSWRRCHGAGRDGVRSRVRMVRALFLDDMLMKKHPSRVCAAGMKGRPGRPFFVLAPVPETRGREGSDGPALCCGQPGRLGGRSLVGTFPPFHGAKTLCRGPGPAAGRHP